MSSMRAFGESIFDTTGMMTRFERFGDLEDRKRLRLHSLRRVNQQNDTFDRGERARNFVGKIHVPRRVNEIQAYR